MLQKAQVASSSNFDIASRYACDDRLEAVPQKVHLLHLQREERRKTPRMFLWLPNLCENLRYAQAGSARPSTPDVATYQLKS
jgi:hypothetical protein